MPFNGSGTYSAPSSSWNPAVSSTSIDPTAWNALLTDISTALSTALLKDGTQAATALIPFANGISTDTISEFTSGVGVSVDGVGLKDGAVNTTQGADIASASTINLTTATGNIVDVTGTTTITAITLAQGYWRVVRFTGILTLTNGASLVLPTAANITTAAGDYALFAGYASSVVRCVGYWPTSGSPLGPVPASKLQGGTLNSSTGYSATDYNAGTKSTGTYTPASSDGNFQYATNGGAHTLAPPSTSCSIIVQYTNNGSAGAITTSGFTKVVGSFTTTNNDKFMCSITRCNSVSLLVITALQ